MTEEERQIFLTFSLGSKKSLIERISIKDEYCGAVEVTVSDIRISNSFQILEKSFDEEKKNIGLIVPHIGSTVIPEKYLDTFNMEYLNQGGDGYSATMGNTIVNAGSNTNGSFRFTAPSTPGTYYISAPGTYAGKPIVPPCLEIKVR